MGLHSALSCTQGTEFPRDLICSIPTCKWKRKISQKQCRVWLLKWLLQQMDRDKGMTPHLKCVTQQVPRTAPHPLNCQRGAQHHEDTSPTCHGPIWILLFLGRSLQGWGRRGNCWGWPRCRGRNNRALSPQHYLCHHSPPDSQPPAPGSCGAGQVAGMFLKLVSPIA